MSTSNATSKSADSQLQSLRKEVESLRKEIGWLKSESQQDRKDINYLLRKVMELEGRVENESKNESID